VEPNAKALASCLFLAACVSTGRVTHSPEKSLDGGFWTIRASPWEATKTDSSCFTNPAEVVRIFNGQGEKVLDEKIQSPNIVATRLKASPIPAPVRLRP